MSSAIESDFPAGQAFAYHGWGMCARCHIIFEHGEYVRNGPNDVLTHESPDVCISLTQRRLTGALERAGKFQELVRLMKEREVLNEKISAMIGALS